MTTPSALRRCCREVLQRAADMLQPDQRGKLRPTHTAPSSPQQAQVTLDQLQKKVQAIAAELQQARQMAIDMKWHNSPLQVPSGTPSRQDAQFISLQHVGDQHGEPRNHSEHIQLGRKLGSGSYGVVLEAKVPSLAHLSLHEEGLVAVKVGCPSSCLSTTFRGQQVIWGAPKSWEDCDASIAREIAAGELIRGKKHLMQVLGSGVLAGCGAPIIIMQLGNSLEQEMEWPSNPKFSDITEYLMQLCLGLSELEQSAIVHRHIKPGNLIVLKDRGGLQIADYGALRTAARTAFTVMSVAGSPAYWAPEVGWQKAQASCACDIWSAGCVLLAMGKGPMRGPPAMPFQAKVKEEYQAMKQVRGGGSSWRVGWGACVCEGEGGHRAAALALHTMHTQLPQVACRDTCGCSAWRLAT